MDEGIAMMRAVWNDDPVTFPTRWIAAKIDTMRMQPKPCAPIPIWIGLEIWWRRCRKRTA